MILLLLLLNVQISATIVLSYTCPYCVDVKSKCKKPENVSTMDCTTFKINGKPAESLIKQPKIIDNLPLLLKLLQGNITTLKLTLGCLYTDYQLEYMDEGLESNTTNSTLEITAKKTYTLKSCMFQYKKAKVCDMLEDMLLKHVDKDIRIITNNCTFIEFASHKSSKSIPFPTLSYGLVIFFIVLLQFFV